MALRVEPTLTLEDLPDALLSRVLALAGREAGPVTSLVSKRWNRLVFTEPDFWRRFELSSASLAALADPVQQERWFRSKLRLLQRVASLVEKFVIEDCCSLLLRTQQPLLPVGWLTQLLQLLQPDVLYGLLLDGNWPPYPAIAAALAQPPAQLEQRSLGLASQLQRFTGLERLGLHCAATFSQHEAQALSGLRCLRTLMIQPALGLPSCFPTVLQELSAPLECLLLSGPHIPAGTVAAVLRLTGLQSLELRCFESALDDPQPLTALRQLTRLVLISGAGTPVHLPQPCHFSSALQWYMMAEQEISLIAQPQIHAMPDQRFLQIAGARLINVQYGDQQLGITAFNMPSLGGLLAALSPAGQPGLRSLSLFATMLSADAVCARDVAASSRLLASIDSLSLIHCILTSGTWDDLLAAVLAYAPSLRKLQLDSCLVEEPIPDCVLQATGLTSLSLAGNELEELPEGPALAGLVTLDLSQNRFPRLPPALSSAAALTSLKLDRNHDLELWVEDLKVLKRMAGLAELHLSALTVDRAPQAVRDRLWLRLVVAEHE